MDKRYDLKVISTLLTEGFTAEELRRFCFDTPQFRPVYDALAPGTGKSQIIDFILEYAESKLLFDLLLAWAREQNSAKYADYRPAFEGSFVSPIPDPPVSFEMKGIYPDERVEESRGLQDSPLDAPSPPEVTSLRLDTAVPSQAVLGRVFDLAVSVRQRSAPVLSENDLTQVRSGEVQVSWPEAEAFIRLRVQVKAPECEIQEPAAHAFRLYRGQDSPVFYFQLIPRQLGDISIVVTVYQEDDWLGSTRVHTVAQEQVAGRVQIEVTSHALFGQDAATQPATRIGGFALTDELETQKDGLQKLIQRHQQRLQILKEQQATYGISVDPRIPIEIKDIETELEKLRAELATLPGGTPQPMTPAGSSPVSPATRFRQIKIKNLKARLDALVADYEAASNQLNNTLSEVDRARLKRQVESLEQEIGQVENELNSLAAPTVPPHPVN